MLAGITLLFTCRSSSALLGMLNDYVVSARSLRDLKKRAVNLGKRESHRIAVDTKMSCEYLGLYDTYYVCGPLKSGALLGYTSTWGIKQKTLLPMMNEIRIRKALSGSSKGAYVIDAVYVIGSQKPPIFKRRIIEAALLVEHDGKKDILEVAGRLANSPHVKRKITRDLRRQVLPEELEIAGFSSIRRWASPSVGLGRCFKCNVKRYAKEFMISRLLHEEKKLVFPKPLR